MDIREHELKLKENYKERLLILSKAKDNELLQKVEIEHCKKDILYYFKYYVWTDKNKTLYSNDLPDVIPFIPYPFQEELILEIWESIIEWNKPLKDRKPWVLTNVFIEKSRQMGVSWAVIEIFWYWFLFHKHKYTVISMKQDEVDKPWDMDSMFEKLRFQMRNLPNWMLPVWLNKESWKDKTNSFMNLSDPNSQASITWKSANPDAWRWWTRNAIFMDEMASMHYAHEIRVSAWNNSPCLIYNSTPKWEWNEFYKMRKLTLWRKDAFWREIAPEIKGLRYHWSEHPLYDQERYKWKIQWKTREEIAQELEIDYNTALIGRVYPDFPKEPSNIEYKFDKPLYIWIDNSHWWTDPNAIIVMQPEDHYYNLIDAIELHTTPQRCAEFLSCQPKFQMTDYQSAFFERYKKYNWREAIFISDPYDTKQAMWNSTILDDYKKVWINLSLPQNRNKKEQINNTKTNIYKIRYNENCIDMASAIMNATYPEIKETTNTTSPHHLPIHNWTSHFRTALEYWINYLLENPILVKKKAFIDTRPKRNHLTWELRYNTLEK